MRYYSRLGVYKASNVLFNRQTCTAVSYDWWFFVKRVNGMVVFNSYRYSVTTSRHQSKVRQLMRELGIKIDLEVSVAEGLQNENAARLAIINFYFENAPHFHVDQLCTTHFAEPYLIKKTYGVELSETEIQKQFDLREEFECDEFLRRVLKAQERREKLEAKKTHVCQRCGTRVEPDQETGCPACTHSTLNQIEPFKVETYGDLRLVK